MNLSKFDALGNPFMSLLSEANDLHRTTQQKHGELLDLLQESNVKFKDIRIHLINQAKSCHLYRRDLWNANKNCMDFRPLKSLGHFSWANSIINFVAWANKNYKDYGVPKARVARKNDKPREIVVRREIKEPALSAAPKTAPSITGEVFNTANSKLELPKSTGTQAPAATPSVTEETHAPLCAPVTKELSLLEKQQIIFSNLDILGQKALELGAGFEWNELMVAMGLTENILEDVE